VGDCRWYVGDRGSGTGERASEADVMTSTSLRCLGARVGVELGGMSGPERRSGSSLGLGGGMGRLKSMSGSSFLMGRTTLSGFAADLGLGFGPVLRLDDLEMVGVIMTSLGGVNTSVGGS
jgi:hypothetical protein